MQYSPRLMSRKITRFNRGKRRKRRKRKKENNLRSQQQRIRVKVKTNKGVKRGLKLKRENTQNTIV